MTRAAALVLLSGLAAAVAGAGLCPAVAEAEPRPYRGPHPIDLDGHWHEEPSVHVHEDLPVGDEAFVAIDGVLTFLGDPGAYGFQGDVWTYEGVHPLPARVGGYCGIDGRHDHPWAPEGDFQREDGAWSFVGAMQGGGRTYVPERREPGALVLRAHGGVDRDAREVPARAYPVHLPLCSTVVDRDGRVVTIYSSPWPCRPPVRVRRGHLRRGDLFPPRDHRGDRRWRRGDPHGRSGRPGEDRRRAPDTAGDPPEEAPAAEPRRIRVAPRPVQPRR